MTIGRKQVQMVRQLQRQISSFGKKRMIQKVKSMTKRSNHGPLGTTIGSKTKP